MRTTPRLTIAFFTLLLLSPFLRADDVKLTQILSREHPNFPKTGGVMTVGDDGNVYIAGTTYVLRVSRDGKKIGGTVERALTGLAANKDGVLATSNAHFSKSVNLYDSHFIALGSLGGFTGNDEFGWDGPGTIEAGASGDFYALDQHVNRIVRLNAAGKNVLSYPLVAQGEAARPKPFMMRVSEGTERFYFAIQGKILAVGFDGKLKWEMPSTLSGNPWDGWSGGFDTDEEGRLYILEWMASEIKVFNPDGTPTDSIPLQFGDHKPTQTSRNSALRLYKDEIIVRQASATELFHVYDRATGVRKSIAAIDYEQLTATFPSRIWTAGQAVPFKIDFVTSTYKADPAWHVWIRPFNDALWTELPINDGQITPPQAFGGLYQIKVSAGMHGAEGEYVLRDYVEIRTAGATGSALVQTPLGRMYWAAGEVIPVKVILRGTGFPESLELKLNDGSGRTVQSVKMAVKEGIVESGTLSSDVTRALGSGRYTLTTSAAGITVMSQPIVIGPGTRNASPISFMTYGDYGMILPVDATLNNVPENVAEFVDRSDKLGLNFFSDRLGNSLHWKRVEWSSGERNQLAEQLKSDPNAIAPEAVNIESPVQQTVAAMTSRGWRYMPVPTYMDDGLPIGLDWAGRGTPGPAADKLLADRVTFVTQALKDYGAFHGWSWTANWWVIHFGAAATTSPEQKQKYIDAKKVATETGKWDPVIDEVSDIWQNRTVTAQAMLRGALDTVDPTKKSAVSGPYRAVQVYPPLTFSNVDEVDLHYQAEQIQPPGVYWHDVDFQKRPNKPAWGHPEIWNDDGTGWQIGPTLFAMLMRGADGIGTSGPIPNWGRLVEDPRRSYIGTPSIFRSLFQGVRPYAPWLQSLEKRDPVAILVSRRMFRFDDGWTGVLGARHFDRLYEAYQSCLAAHMPASFVFAEDVNDDTFKAYKAVLLVGERVELEPLAVSALDKASAAGLPIFYDGTCRAELMQSYKPLGVAFDQVEKDPSAWQDDSSYWRFPAYFAAHVVPLRAALQSIVAPIAEVNDSEILLTEKGSGKMSALFVINNRMLDMEPGLHWRTALGISTRLPGFVDVKLPSNSGATYDAFAMKQVEITGDGKARLDLRNTPARLLVTLPEKIDRLLISASPAVAPGETLAWNVAVHGPSDRPIDAPIPLRVQLLDTAQNILDERYLATPIAKADQSFIIPITVNAESPLTLVVTELLSGINEKATINFSAPVATTEAVKPDEGSEANGSPLARSTPFLPLDQRFGPQVSDVAVSSDNKTAVFTTFNRDANVYSVDLATGDVRKPARIGHAFTYAPIALDDGAIVVGYDLNSTEGYHVYRLNADGSVRQRFAQFGLPQRLPIWCFGGHLTDRPPSFATPASGKWVASAGNLGLVVWDEAGKVLWSQDWRENRRYALISAPDDSTLILGDGAQLVAYESATGAERWRHTLGATGSIQQITSSRDGKTLAIRTDTEGGRVSIVRDGNISSVFAIVSDVITLSPDGQSLAAISGQQVSYYSTEAGLRWVYRGDDSLHHARFSPDASKLVVSSEIGTLYVLDRNGATLLEHDAGTLPVPAWTPAGTLVCGTWAGTVLHFDDQLKLQSTSRLEGSESLTQESLLQPDASPVARMTGWTNSEPQPFAIDKNLLANASTLIKVLLGTRESELKIERATILDGKPDPSPQPWVKWKDINMIDSGWVGSLSLVLDTFHTQLRVNAITLVEDPAHPHSWLRDCVLEYWNARSEKWMSAGNLLSDTATHTHVLKAPVESSRFRLVSSGKAGTWPVGNIRLAEIVLHGDALGASHPDAAEKKPVAILFDEKLSDIQPAFVQPFNRGLTIPSDPGAFSGASMIQLDPADKPNVGAGPLFVEKFSHTIPGWDFEIAENPEPGQYRYLRFAWKGLTPATRGVTLRLGPTHSGGLAWNSGEATPFELTKAVQLGDSVPGDWKVETIDLWQAFEGKPVRIRAMGFGAAGGPAGFDRILLGQSIAELDANNVPEK